MFQLSAGEADDLRFQFGISSWGGRRYRPRVFTEQGAAMLSGLLSSRRAVEVNIAVMRAFVSLRRAMSIDHGLEKRISLAEAALKAHELELGESAALLNEAFAAIRGILPRRHRAATKRSGGG